MLKKDFRKRWEGPRDTCWETTSLCSNQGWWLLEEQLEAEASPLCASLCCKVHLDCLNFRNTKAKQSVGWMLQGDKEMWHDEPYGLSFVYVWKHLRITPLQRADVFKACLNISTAAQVGGGADITRDVKVSEPQRTEQPTSLVNM